MSGGVKVFLFIILLPFFAGIGHDVYLNYFSDDDKIKQVQKLQIAPEEFMMSDIGWIWNEYHPQTMQISRNAIEPSIWQEKVDPVLQLPTILVGSFPFLIGGIFLLITFVAGIWPFSRYGALRRQSDDDFAVYKHAKSKTVKYSKK